MMTMKSDTSVNDGPNSVNDKDPIILLNSKPQIQVATLILLAEQAIATYASLPATASVDHTSLGLMSSKEIHHAMVASTLHN